MMTIEIRFTPEPIIVPPLVSPGRETGACVEFLGLVREQEGAERLAGLRYEAYEPMAGEQMERIFQELAQSTTASRAEFIHRLGLGAGRRGVHLHPRAGEPSRSRAALCAARLLTG